MSEASTKPTKFSGYKMVVCAALLVGGTLGMGYYPLSLYMQPWAAYFETNVGVISGIFSCLGITTMLASFVSGPIIEKLGLRKLILLGEATVVVGFVIFYVAANVLMMYIGAIIMGLGFAWAGMIAIGTIVPSWFIEKRGVMVGVTVGVSSLGGVVGNLVFSHLIESAGWRFSVLVALIAIVVLYLPSVFFFKGKPEDVGEHPLGYDPEAAVTDSEGKDGGGAFKAILKTPQFWLLCVLVFSCGSIIAGMNPHFASIITSKGHDLVFAGTLAATMNIAGIVGGLILGTINDKLGLRATLVWCCVIGLAAMSSIYFCASTAGAICWALGFGLAQGLLSTLYPLLIAPVFGQTPAYEDIVGFFNGVSGLAEAVIPTVMGFIYVAAGTYDATATTAIAILLVGIVCGFSATSLAKRSKKNVTCSNT